MSRNGFVEKARSVYENNLLLVTIIAVLIGFIMRFLVVQPSEHGPPPTLLQEVVKEVGGFILATFLIAFLYEAFISYRTKQQFREELHSVLREGFRGGLHSVHERRPTVGFKADKLRNTETSVIEMGTALNTFKNYLVKNQTTSMEPGSQGYRDVLEERMRDGVKLTCLVLDPDMAATPAFKELNPDLERKIADTLIGLKPIRDEMNQKYPGQFEIRLYRAMPTFACIAFDSETGSTGRLLLSPYAFHQENSDLPVFEIHQGESPAVFEVYQKAILALKAQSKPLP